MNYESVDYVVDLDSSFCLGECVNDISNVFNSFHQQLFGLEGGNNAILSGKLSDVKRIFTEINASKDLSVHFKGNNPREKYIMKIIKHRQNLQPSSTKRYLQPMGDLCNFLILKSFAEQHIKIFEIEDTLISRLRINPLHKNIFMLIVKIFDQAVTE